MMLHRSKTLPGACLAACLWLTLGVGVGACGGEHTHAEEAAEYPITRPLRTDSEISHEYVAQIRSIQHIELRALEPGYLEEVFVDEGQLVKEGQRMFQIMPRLYQAELQKAAAEVEFAQIEYNNTRSLQEGNVVAPTELALAKARLDKANAELALAKVHLSLTEIRAPFDGIMDRLVVRKGSLLSEGELLTTLADNSQMWVYFNMTESDYLDYKTRKDSDSPLPVQLRLANNKIFDQQGLIQTIEADFNNETGNIAFRATFPNPDGLLRHGETGKVIMSTPLNDVLLVPQKATFDILDKKFVFVVDDANIIHQREITVLEELPHLYVVGEGLADTDRILLDGLRKVRDGDEIGIQYEEPQEVIAHLDVPAE